MSDHIRTVPDRVLAVLGRGVLPVETPILRADDLGVLRGDGIFETMHVRGTPPHAWLLAEHLHRMARSAARLGIPLPDKADLTTLAGQALAAWPAETEGALRLVCTRGGEHGGPVTAFATLNGIGPAVLPARRNGITVATAPLGCTAHGRENTPWLLAGAKTLSYAVNMAALRWATSTGVDDVLWTSTDGYALEAPTSTLIWRTGDTLCTVPPEHTGILAGTTAAWLLEHAGELGLTAETRMIRPDDLHAADGVWLVSSVRGAARVRTLDGVKLPGDAGETVRMLDLLGFPV